MTALAGVRAAWTLGAYGGGAEPAGARTPRLAEGRGRRGLPFLVVIEADGVAGFAAEVPRLVVEGSVF